MQQRKAPNYLKLYTQLMLCYNSKKHSKNVKEKHEQLTKNVVNETWENINTKWEQITRKLRKISYAFSHLNTGHDCLTAHIKKITSKIQIILNLL